MSYEKRSRGYQLFRYYIWFVDRMIHRRVVVLGRENIPQGKPIVFAPNHQNALSDPMAVLLNVSHQPVWLARADIFGKNRIIDAILRFLKIMPVYRMRDGIDSLGRNDETFQKSVQVLENNGALALFPEAMHTFKRQIREHKKAIPRIVFMALEQSGGQLDIQIVPTGIYYSHYWKFHRSLIVNFGKPISVKSYYDEYLNDPQSAMKKLRLALQDASRQLTVNIESTEYYDEFELVRELYGGTHHEGRLSESSNSTNEKLSKEFKRKTSGRMLSDMKLTGRLDKFEREHPDEAADLVKELRGFNNLLHMNKLNNLAINTKPGILCLLARILGLAAGLPVFLYGLIFNALPYFGIDLLVKSKIKDQAFWSSVSYVLTIIVFPLFYILELWAVSPWVHGWWRLLFLISLPFAGKLAYYWYSGLIITCNLVKLYITRKFKRSVWKEINRKKEELFAKLDNLILK